MAVSAEDLYEALSALGIRGRTEKEWSSIMHVCKDFKGGNSLSRLCERDFPELLELAKDKLEHARRMSVRNDGLSESEAVEFVKSMVGVRTEVTDVDSLRSEVPAMVQAFKPPCEKILGAEALMRLQERLDIRADEIRHTEERAYERGCDPSPTIIFPSCSRPGAVPGEIPELKAYREMKKTPIPEKPRPFVEPVVPPKSPEYGANYLRKHQAEIRRTKSEPEIVKPYPKAPLSTMKVLAHKEPLGKPSIARSRRLPHLATCRSDLPGREYQSPSGLLTVPDSMVKQWQQARMIAAGRDCLRSHHHFMHTQPTEEGKAADTRRRNVRVVRTLKKEEYERMHPKPNPVAMTFVNMEPASVFGRAASYWDVFPPDSDSECSSTSRN